MVKKNEAEKMANTPAANEEAAKTQTKTKKVLLSDVDFNGKRYAKGTEPASEFLDYLKKNGLNEAEYLV